MAFDSLTPSVSVIIPVFNTAQYLDRCLDSVLGQTLSDLEVICVDDCSTDNSLDILQRRSVQDPRIRIMSKERNAGVSATRNLGLEAARGEYIYFMDSDDWIAPRYLEELHGIAIEKNLNVVINVKFEEEFTIPVSSARRSKDAGGVQVVSGWYPPDKVANTFLCVVWMRLYRRKFLLDNAISFPEELSASEDYYFTRLSEMVNGPVWLFSGQTYYHLRRPGSLSTLNDFDNMIAARMVFRELRQRQIDLAGLKLFYTGDLSINSEERFLFTRAFFEEIEPFVKHKPEVFNELDRFCIETVLTCSDWKDYINRYNPKMTVNFVLKHVRRQR